MLAVAVPKRNKLQNIIVLTPKDGAAGRESKTFDREIWTFGDKHNGRGRKSPYMRRAG